jgi:dTDP-4-dehydrorhamnose 3,5-epimerase
LSEIFKQLSNCSIKHNDERGYLEVLYENNSTILKRSFSKKGVFRGLHRQPHPFAQVKLVRVISGSIVDFILDVDNEERKLYTQRITPQHDWILIDALYAHGFYALEDTIFEYICDGGYCEDAEESFSILEYLKGLSFVDQIIISEKDLAAEVVSV